MLIVGAILVFVLWKNYKNEIITDPITVEIKKGEGIREIAEKLSSQKVINNKYYFEYYSLWHNKSLQEGIYIFQPFDKVTSVYNKLRNGQISQQKITIIEGWREEQIGQYLNSKNIIDYQSFIQIAGKYPGKLFPDTYFITLKPTADQLIAQMTKNYTARTANFNPTNEQLILASMIEREARKDEDRALIASVFYNRIKIGMRLESDVTVEYGLDNDRLSSQTKENIGQFIFWTPLKAGESKTTNSEYNTYKISGLPPTPICNPGLKSIVATVNPAQSDYYYFLTDKDGKAHFAKTKTEHDGNIGKYLN